MYHLVGHNSLLHADAKFAALQISPVFQKRVQYRISIVDLQCSLHKVHFSMTL